jgi:hypothetical protein
MASENCCGAVLSEVHTNTGGTIRLDASFLFAIELPVAGNVAHDEQHDRRQWRWRAGGCGGS